MIVVAILGGILIGIGAIVGLIGYVRLIMLAFRIGGTGWGIASFFIGWIFGIMHWSEGGKRPLLFVLASVVLYGVGYVLLIVGILASASTTTTTSLLT